MSDRCGGVASLLGFFDAAANGVLPVASGVNRRLDLLPVALGVDAANPTILAHWFEAAARVLETQRLTISVPAGGAPGGAATSLRLDAAMLRAVARTTDDAGMRLTLAQTLGAAVAVTPELLREWVAVLDDALVAAKRSGLRNAVVKPSPQGVEAAVSDLADYAEKGVSSQAQAVLLCGAESAVPQPSLGQLRLATPRIEPSGREVALALAQVQRRPQAYVQLSAALQQTPAIARAAFIKDPALFAVAPASIRDNVTCARVAVSRLASMYLCAGTRARADEMVWTAYFDGGAPGFVRLANPPRGLLTKQLEVFPEQAFLLSAELRADPQVRAIVSRQQGTIAADLLLPKHDARFAAFMRESPAGKRALLDEIAETTGTRPAVRRFDFSGMQTADAITLLHEQPLAFAAMSETTRADLGVALTAAARLSPFDVVPFLPASVAENPAFWQPLAASSSLWLSFTPQRFLNNRRVAAAAIARNDYAVGAFPLHVRSDPDVWLEAMAERPAGTAIAPILREIALLKAASPVHYQELRRRLASAELGCYWRFGSVADLESVLAAREAPPATKPKTLIVLSTADFNGFTEQALRDLRAKLADPTAVIIEAGSRDELEQRGVAAAERFGAFLNVVVVTHGFKDRLFLGESSWLGLGDVADLAASLGQMVRPGGTVLFDACSTAEGGHADANVVNQTARALPGRLVLGAHELVRAGLSLAIDGTGQIRGATFSGYAGEPPFVEVITMPATIATAAS